MHPVQRSGRRTVGLRPTGLAAAFASGGDFLPKTLLATSQPQAVGAPAAGFISGSRPAAPSASNAFGLVVGAGVVGGSVTTLTSPSAGSISMPAPVSVAKEAKKPRSIAGIIPEYGSSPPLFSPDGSAATVPAVAALVPHLQPSFASSAMADLLKAPVAVPLSTAYGQQLKPDPGVALPLSLSSAAAAPQHAFQPVTCGPGAAAPIASPTLGSPPAASAAASPSPSSAPQSLPTTPPPQFSSALLRSATAASSYGSSLNAMARTDGVAVTGSLSQSASFSTAGLFGSGSTSLGSPSGANYTSSAPGLAGMVNLPGLVSRYRGVSCVSGGYGGQRFKATVNHRGVAIELGPFETEEDAARAYDSKARELHGERARLNFPDTAAGERTRMGRSAYRGISWQVSPYTPVSVAVDGY